VKLEFLKPMETTNQAVYSVKQGGDGTTRVSWAMTGKNGMMGKAFSMVVDMDKMVGAEFENGMANLKAVSEAQAKAGATKVAAEGIPVATP